MPIVIESKKISDLMDTYNLSNMESFLPKTIDQNPVLEG
jgi:hypothetical protein